ETPVTDGERVYAYFGMVGVFCYDLSGKPLWGKDLGAYRMFGNWGTSSSPALDGDRLFIQCDNQENSFLVALDRKTGKELWRVNRSARCGPSRRAPRATFRWSRARKPTPTSPGIAPMRGRISLPRWSTGACSTCSPHIRAFSAASTPGRAQACTRSGCPRQAIS